MSALVEWVQSWGTTEWIVYACGFLSTFVVWWFIKKRKRGRK